MSDSYAHIVVLNWKKSNVLAELGIDAERRSIYRDIEEINKALWLLENEDYDADIFAAEEAIETDENDSEKFIVYDRHLKGFRVVRRKYELSDIRLMAECIYASRYISQSEAERFLLRQIYIFRNVYIVLFQDLVKKGVCGHYRFGRVAYGVFV